MVGGCPWVVPSVRGASWGSWVGAVKNDTNFQGGYAYAVAAPLAPSGGLGQENRHRGGSLSNPCPGPVQSVSNMVPGPVIARVLGSCVPAMTTGTQGYGPIPR